MIILITGASGFLGKHLSAYLEAKGHIVEKVNSKIADLTVQDTLDQFNGQQYDQIYHLAAWTQAGDFCQHHSGEQWIINQQINTNVLAWWKAHQPKAKLIALGTSASYASESNLDEDNYMQGIPNEKYYAYAMSKRMLLAGLQSLQKQFGMNYLYVIPSTLYGPHYHTDGRQLHFIFDLIRKIIRGKLYGKPIILWGDGNQRRELVYVDDFVETLYRLNEIKSNDYFNIGADEDYSIKDFARMICDEIGFDFNNMQYDINGFVGAKSKILDVTKLKQSLPLSKTPLQQGLKATIAWVQQSSLV
jgi:GDP-L-fucose synthase